jgi:UrcA family protein
MSTKPIAILLIAAAAIATPAAAKNTQGEIATSERVGFSDLDLDTDRGSLRLVHRLTRAADDACGGDPRMKFGEEHMADEAYPAYKNCRDAALDRALGQLNRPRVTATYQALFPGSHSAAATVYVAAR